MKAADAALLAAINASERVMLPDRLRVDWNADGYDGDGTIDDLSRHVLSVDLDGTLQPDVPDDVRLVQGNAAATLTVELGGGSATNDTVRPVTYWSPVAPAGDPDVPLAGLERRFRPCSWEVGFVTETGPQYVPMFTGRTSNLPVDGDNVHLVAIDNRSLLRDAPVLPALPASYTDPSTQELVAPGLEATWLVSYAFAQGGMYTSPPPRPGIRVWAPMHGSGQPFVHDALGGLFSAGDYALSAGSVDTACRFVDGPFVAALSSEDLRQSAIEGTAAAGTALYDVHGRSIGRIEYRVRVPNPNDIGTSGAAWVQADTWEGGLVVRGTGDLEVWIGGTLQAIITGTGIADGGWHFVGLWWDRIGGAWRVNVDSIVTTGSTGALPASGPGLPEDWAFEVIVQGGSAIAEVQITAGTTAVDPWLVSIPFTPGALIDRSDNQLVATVPDSAADWWELLKNLATAERGATYCSADGTGRYRTPSALATSQAQQTQLTLTSLTNISELTWEPDASRIRNKISCPWTQVTVHATAPDHCWDASSVIAVPPGQTVTQLVTLAGPTLGRTIGIAATVNTKPDGTGTQSGPVTVGNATSALVGSVTITVTLLTPTTARVDLANRAASWRYLADNQGGAALGLLGVYTSVEADPAPQTAQDDASIASKGPVSLDIPGSVWRQQAGWALGIAQQTLADCADPLPAITSLVVWGNPLADYYDRFLLQDTAGFRANGTYWIKSIRFARGGPGDLTMTIAATATRDIASFDAAPGFDTGVWS